jgi:hypothetical protein
LWASTVSHCSLAVGTKLLRDIAEEVASSNCGNPSFFCPSRNHENISNQQRLCCCFHFQSLCVWLVISLPLLTVLPTEVPIRMSTTSRLNFCVILRGTSHDACNLFIVRRISHRYWRDTYIEVVRSDVCELIERFAGKREVAWTDN